MPVGCIAILVAEDVHIIKPPPPHKLFFVFFISITQFLSPIKGLHRPNLLE